MANRKSDRIDGVLNLELNCLLSTGFPDARPRSESFYHRSYVKGTFEGVEKDLSFANDVYFPHTVSGADCTQPVLWVMYVLGNYRAGQ